MIELRRRTLSGRLVVFFKKPLFSIFRKLSWSSAFPIIVNDYIRHTSDPWSCSRFCIERCIHMIKWQALFSLRLFTNMHWRSPCFGVCMQQQLSSSRYVVWSRQMARNSVLTVWLRTKVPIVFWWIRCSRIGESQTGVMILLRLRLTGIK